MKNFLKPQPSTPTPQSLHSGKLTWNLKRGALQMTVLIKKPLFRFHVSFPVSNPPKRPLRRDLSWKVIDRSARSPCAKKAKRALNLPLHAYIPTYTLPPTYVLTYINNKFIHTYVHTYIRTYIHTYIHTYIRTYIHT